MKSIYLKWLVLAWVGLCLPASAFAVSTEEDQKTSNPVTDIAQMPFRAVSDLTSGIFDLGNIIVGGKRLGSPFSDHVSKSETSSTIITAQEIDNSSANNVQDVMIKTPGFSFSDLVGNGEEPSLDVRGLSGGSNFVFMLDGVRLNEPKSNNINFSLIPVHLAEQIEISRGGTSFLYGEAARAGAANLVPKQAKELGFHATVESRAGSFDSWGENFEAFHKTENDNLYITGDIYHTRGFRQNSSVEKESFYTKYMRDLSDKAQVGVSYLYADAYLDRSGSIRESLLNSLGREATERPRNFADLDAHLVTGQLNVLLMEHLALSGNAYYRKSQEISNVNFATFDTFDNELDLNSDIWGTTVQLDHSKPIFGNWVESILVGVDYIDNKIDEEDFNRSKSTLTRLSTTVDTVADRQTLGIFGKASLIWNDRLKGYYGVRHDDIDTDNTDKLDPTRNIPIELGKYSQSTGVSYQVSKPLEISFNYSNSYRAPSLSDLYSNPAFGNSTALEPEEADDYEVGALWKEGNLEFRATAFYSEMTNEILFDPTAPNPASFNGRGLKVNVGKTNRYGFENSLIYQLCASSKLKLGYTFTESEFGADSPTRTSFKKDDEVPLVPNHRYFMGLEVVPVNNAIVFLDMFALSDQLLSGDLTNETNGRRLPSYTVFNLTGSYTYKQWKFSAAVKNLLDEEYETGGSTSGTSTIQDNFYVPAPGRNYEFKASYSF